MQIIHGETRIRLKQARSLPELFQGYSYHFPQDIYEKIFAQGHVGSLLQSLGDIECIELSDVDVVDAFN